MGLLKNLFNQTRKPEGILGRMMIAGMNTGHAKLSDWGDESADGYFSYGDIGHRLRRRT